MKVQRTRANDASANLVHLIRHSKELASWKRRKRVVQALWAIYRVADVATFDFEPRRRGMEVAAARVGWGEDAIRRHVQRALRVRMTENASPKGALAANGAHNAAIKSSSTILEGVNHILMLECIIWLSCNRGLLCAGVS